MPAISTTRMTATQYKQLGDDPPGIRLELVDGEIEISPGQTPQHSRVVTQLGYLLMDHLDGVSKGVVLSSIDVILGEYDVRRPDVVYFIELRRHLIGEELIQHPPDLAVEVISSWSERTDREIKFKLYEQGGVAHYWIVDPMTETLEAFRLVEGYYQKCAGGSGEDLVSAPPFEGLEIPLGRLWLK
ncbi:MAG: Uma2 family endonuclease [Planctomycetota bacterium]